MRRLRSLALVVCLVLPGATVTPAAQQPTTAEPAARSMGVARIDDDLLAAVIAEAKQADPSKLAVVDKVGDSTALWAGTTRSMMARFTIDAALKGKRYTPPDDIRLDMLMIKCGDSDPGEIFQCARVTLKDADGHIVEPLYYAAKPETHGSILAGTWIVNQVTASYAVDGLLHGFTIDYADDIGGDWTLTVTAAQASKDLLLGVAAAVRQ